jgi:hypothetical protein
MASCAGDLDGALGGLLSANVFEVDEELLGLTQKRVAVGFDRKDAIAGVHKVNHVQQRPHGVNVQAGDHGSFFGIGLRHDHTRDFFPAGLDGDQ